MAVIETELIVTLIGVLAPILIGAFGLNAKRSKDSLVKVDKKLDVAKRYLSISNEVTNQVSETIKAITVAMEDGDISKSESRIIGSQLSSVIGTLGRVANNDELRKEELN